MTYKPLPQDDPTQRQPDITRARERLGWEPTIPLAAGPGADCGLLPGAAGGSGAERAGAGVRGRSARRQHASGATRITAASPDRYSFLRSTAVRPNANRGDAHDPPFCRSPFPASLLLGVAVNCARNPVTGKSELSLVSEGQEIQMGQQAAQEVGQQHRATYDDQQLQDYVAGDREADGRPVASGPICPGSSTW